MKKGTWPKTTECERAVRRLIAPRVHVFLEREVFAPPGHVTRWPW